MMYLLFNKSKKKETLSSIGDGETSSKNEETACLSNTQKSKHVEKQTSPNPSPAEKREIAEKTMGSSPSRRSDRGKKSDEVPASPDISSKEEKPTVIDMSGDDVHEGNMKERKDAEKGDRKRKRSTARDYKDLFKPQKMRIPLDNDKDLRAQDKSVQANISGNGGEDKELKESPNEAQAELLGETLMGSDQGEHVPHPCRTKLLDGKSAESGYLEKQIGGDCSPSKRNIDHYACSPCTDNGNNISHTSFSRINHDLENQQEPDLSEKVIGTCKAAGVTVNAGNNDAAANLQSSGNILNSSKFLEFWVPVPMSNVQVEQYCATLLSNAMHLCSSSRNYTVEGALHVILMSNRKCCNHPYLVDLNLQSKLMEGRENNMLLDVGIKASGKLHFLDLILAEVKQRKLRVLILFQPTVVTAKESPTSGVILTDYTHQRFGQDSYECVVSGITPSKRQTAVNSFNNDMSRFIFFLEHRSCHSSIKLESVDIIIMLDSDLNPANDLRALQKLSIDSQSEQIMIFRLYSLSTLEEKILKLAESNVPFDSRSQNIRNRYDALLMWGASNLFDKLAKFHNQSVLSISSEENFMKDVVEEFLYVVSHKYENKDTSKSIITRVQNCGIYGKNIPLHGEISTHLPDGNQPHVFWKKLLEGRSPIWKFVSILTPRQRKRRRYFEGSSKRTRTVDGGGIKTRKKTVNSTAEPSQSKCVIEGETGSVNEGGSRVPAHNKPRSLSRDPSQSAGFSNEKSLHDFLKPTVSELCNVLKFSEDVEIIVRNFLEFVLENYIMSSEAQSTLQAFMISVCWIGSSILKNKIDRSESFNIAKKHLNASCMLDEANMVYEKLKSAEKTFLEHTDIDDLIRAVVPATQGVNLNAEKYQRIQTNKEEPNKCKEQTKDFFGKEQDEIGNFNREWDEKRVKLENDYNMDRNHIRTLYSDLRLRSEKLTILKREFADMMEEHERLREIHLKDLEAKLLAAKAHVAVNTEVPLRGSGHDSPEASPAPIEALSLDEPMSDFDASAPNVLVANNIELSISHISAEQTNDTLVSNEPIGEVSTQGHGLRVNEVAEAGADATVLSESDGEILAQLHDDIQSDVAGTVECVEMEVLKDDSKQENANDATDCPEGSHAVKDGNETVPNDVVPHTGNCNKENDKDASHVIESVIELGPNDVAAYSNPIEMGNTIGICNEENADYGTISADKSHAGGDHRGSCGPNSSNPLPADVSQEKVLLVQPIASPAPHHLVSTIPLPPSEVADNEGQANPSSLAVINNESSVIAENQSDMPSSFWDPEALAPPGSLGIQNQNASGPELNMLDNLNHVGPRMLSVNNPLQAEAEQLNAMKDNVIRSLEETQQNLKSDCEKEIAETIANIKQKYEVKSQDAVSASVLKKNEIDSHLNRVLMNKVLADAFRSKCQDHTAFGHSGTQQVSPDAFMEQLHRLSGSSIMRHPLGTASTSPGQFFRSQQTPQPSSLQPPPPSSPPPLPPPPPLHPPTPTPPPPSPPPLPPPTLRMPQPPLQIVDQPSALFSTPPSRPSPPPTANLQTASTTPIRPPPNTNPIILDSVSTILFPSIAPTQRPIIARVNSSTTPVTSRPPPDISQITPRNNLRPTSGHSPVTPSSIANRSPTINPSVSTSNLRLNTEIRVQAPLMRPVTNGIVRSPAPHLRPMARNEFRFPAPHLRPLSSNEIRAPPTHIRPFRDTSSLLPDLASNPRMVPGHVTSSHLPTSNPVSPVLPPLPTFSPELLPPLPSEPYFIPAPPPPPSSLPTILSPLPSLPTSGEPALTTNVHMDDAARPVNIRAGSTQFSGYDLVCLSDDD
uniref:helicase protein MOM1-like isoform X2 n=1 Tax=Erigeron canadensis TaxID=72917 RepID=UPI001CB94991|nr:helicase protein MOM1-like isoform X2 [Erigeron canadensis]